MGADKNWAKAYILDPLNAPEPSQETGPGTHFGNTLASNPDLTSSYPSPPDSGKALSPKAFGSKNPFRDSSLIEQSPNSSRNPSVRSRATSDATGSKLSKKPPPDVSVRRESSVGGNSRRSVHQNPNEKHRASSSVSGVHSRGEHRRSSLGPPHEKHRSRSTGHSRAVSNVSLRSGTRSRGDSLNQRPLEFSKESAKLAQRSPHLKKKHQPGADTIDRMDVVKYHHEGPYDAALFARNSSWISSPVAALETSNRETLKATPRENVLDSLQRHRPLDGVASVPPGEQDRFGRKFKYEEGDNMMIFNGANYKRWPGVDYHPDDIKGKGEPSFTVDRALKDHKIRRKSLPQRDIVDPANATASGIEMTGGPIEKSAGRSSSRRSRGPSVSVPTGAAATKKTSKTSSTSAHSSPSRRGSRTSRHSSPAGYVEGLGRSHANASIGGGESSVAVGAADTESSPSGSGKHGLEGLRKRLGSLGKKDKGGAEAAVA